MGEREGEEEEEKRERSKNVISFNINTVHEYNKNSKLPSIVGVTF